MKEVVYRCPVCNKQVGAQKSDPVPLCCGREMEPLPFCRTVPDPEMARNDENDGPCDDGSVSRKR